MSFSPLLPLKKRASHPFKEEGAELLLFLPTSSKSAAGPSATPPAKKKKKSGSRLLLPCRKKKFFSLQAPGNFRLRPRRRSQASPADFRLRPRRRSLGPQKPKINFFFFLGLLRSPASLKLLLPTRKKKSGRQPGRGPTSDFGQEEEVGLEARTSDFPQEEEVRTSGPKKPRSP